MILARREPRWIRRQGAKMIYDSVKTTRVTHSNSALHLNAASHTVALHEARIISLWSWESKTSEMVAIWWKDWNECIIPQKHDKYGMRAVLPQTSMVLMQVLPPKHWVNSVQLLLDRAWNISKTWNNFPTATRIAWVVWSLMWTTFITRARSAQRCNVLDSSKTDIKEGLKRTISCWTHRMYHRGTWYPLPERVTQSASYVPLRHPSDGKTCCRCQLITKKLRWCDTGLRLLVP